MKNLLICLTVLACAGATTPPAPDYPPEQPKGANGPAQRKAINKVRNVWK
mgnify:CR=1 FL=1